VQIDCNATQILCKINQNNICRFCLQGYLQKIHTYVHADLRTYRHNIANYVCRRSKVVNTLCYIQNNVNRSWSHQERFGVCATVCGRTLAPDALCFARRGFGTDDDPKSVEHPPSENCWTLSSLWWFWPASPKIESFRWVDRCILANP